MHHSIHKLSRCASAGCMLLILFLALPLQTHAHATTEGAVSRYSVVGAPTISAAFIDQLLYDNHSSAVGSGQFIYNEGVKYNIDPVFALAFFEHESSFGTAGIAQITLSPGNLRCIPNATCLDGFAAFPTWAAGFDAWYQLIRTLYVDTWGLTTIDQIIPRYAPPTDNNNDSAYISSVEQAVDTWRSEQGTSSGQTTTPPSSGTSGTVTGGTSPSSGTSGTPATSYPPDGYSIVGKPTINADFINTILTNYHSPAAGKGQALYDAGVKAGLDPIYALAFFMHDSIFGTEGMARITLAVGNIPTPVSATCHCQDFHGYRHYTSWEDGFTDWYQFMHDQYVKQGATTLGQIVPDYATAKDPLLIKAFIKTLENRVDLWHKQISVKAQ